MAWRREGRCQTVVDRVDRDAVKVLARLPSGPPMSVRVHADPVVALMAKDDERVAFMRDAEPEYAS
jgi:hypothetical protein